MSTKRFFFTTILVIFSMSAFSQLSTVVKIEKVDQLAAQHEVQVNVVWHFSDGTAKTNQLTLDGVKDGDDIHVPFIGTIAEAALVIGTDVTVSFTDEAVKTSKSFSGFKFSATCVYGEDEGEDQWGGLLRLY